MPVFYALMLLVFMITLFVSASLLFLIQPMVGKMILPFMGGTPAVRQTFGLSVLLKQSRQCAGPGRLPRVDGAVSGLARASLDLVIWLFHDGHADRHLRGVPLDVAKTARDWWLRFQSQGARTL